MKDGIYVASRVLRAPMWKALRDDEGIPIIASWIDEAGAGETADFGELWLRIRDEIRRSRALVFYAHPDDFPFKGALVEVGIALAMDKPVFVVRNKVAIEGRTMRPFGSWILDRRVKMFEELDDAIYAACKAETTRPEAPRIPNVDHLTVQELQALQGRLNLLLQHRVLGDPMGFVCTPSPLARSQEKT